MTAWGRSPMTKGMTDVQRLDGELEAAMLRELQVVWWQLTNTFFRGALRPPVFRLSDSRSRLGAWDRNARTIELSREMVLQTEWGQVIEVLKHEIAHQYAHEALEALDETAHGRAFLHACERMGIDPSASGMPEATGADSPAGKVLKRVADLLALAQSGNQHEAENATALAQRLMLKHNIAIAETPMRRRYGFRHVGAPKARHQESEHILAGILGDHFFVEAIWVPSYRPEDGMRASVLEICGTQENLEMASYVHAFLTDSAERLWREHKRAACIRNNRDRRGYISGVMEGFAMRLRKEQHKCADNGLVWVGDADLRGFHRRRHPLRRSVRLQGHGLSDARLHGRAAGKNIVLHRGVEAPKAPGRGKLLPAGS
jgi:Protein of unknown function (DUF2786)/SprT-like family